MPTTLGALRVLQVAPRYFPYIGGLETHVREVSPRLVRQGVDVTILTTDTRGTLPVDEIAQGVRIRRVRAWPANADYYFAPELRRHIAAGGWDLVHCQGYHTLVAPMAMIAARQAGIPYVVTFHSGGTSSRLRSLLRHAQWAALRPLLADAQALICVSAFEATYFQQRLGLPPERFRIIPNGTEFPAHIAADAPSGIRHEVPLIVSVGRLVRYKGHQRLIAAMPKVLDHRPTAHLHVVGTGPYEGQLRRQISRLHIEPCVTIREIPPGDTHALAALLARASVVALLSEHEGQGLAVMEALSLGRPVLVSADTALQEFADQGLARAVSLKSTPGEVAAALLDQLEDPLIPQNVRLPTWEDCAARLAAVYARVVGDVRQEVNEVARTAVASQFGVR